MKKKIKVWLLGIGVIMLVTPLTLYSMRFYLQNKAKNLYDVAQKKYDKKYAYTINDEGLDQVLYGKDLTEAIKLRNYYLTLETLKIEKDTGIKGSIPFMPNLNFIGVTKPIYFPPSERSKVIMKGFVFNTKCWGYFEVYLPNSVIKEGLPPTPLLNEFQDKLSRLPKGIDYFKSPSSFGFHCN